MNSILGGVSIGGAQVGIRMVIGGVEKVGKTTLACQAPNSLLVPMEMDFGGPSQAHTKKLETWQEVEQLNLELIEGAKRGQVKRGSSIVWDTGTALERIIHTETIRLDPKCRPGNATGLTMETAHDGYGKAYPVANNLFDRFLRYQDELSQYGGINIIITCHVFASKVIDPAAGEYNSWDLQLHSPKNEKTYGKREHITQWADIVGFLHEPMFVQKAGDGEKMSRAVSSGQGRMLGVDRQPGWVAGNRYGLTGLIPIPSGNGWNYLAEAIFQSRGIDVYNRSLG